MASKPHINPKRKLNYINKLRIKKYYNHFNSERIVVKHWFVLGFLLIKFEISLK